MELQSRPDGITLESGLKMENTESPAVTLFADKQSLLGWPWLEEAWRGPFLEVSQRLPADQLASTPERWTTRCSGCCTTTSGTSSGCRATTRDMNSRFRPLCDKIKPRYYWHHMYGNDADFAIGFWERIDFTPAGGRAPAG